MLQPADGRSQREAKELLSRPAAYGCARWCGCEGEGVATRKERTTNQGTTAACSQPSATERAAAAPLPAC